MIIYKDLFTGDELFSDAFPISESEDGIFFIVEGKSVTRTQGGIDDSLIGGNASAEDVQESVDSSSISGVDIVLNHSLNEISYDRKQYMSHLKDYMKALKLKLAECRPERVEGFTAEVQPAVAKVMKDFKNYQFFTGESFKPECTVGLLNWREDGATPYMLFFKDGIEIEKC